MQLTLSGRARLFGLAIATIIVAATVLVMTGTFATARGATASPAATPELSAVSDPPGPLTQAQANHVATLFAGEEAADPSPTAIEGVETSKGIATSMAMPASGQGEGASAGEEVKTASEPVYFETMRGQFTLDSGRVPRGQKAPKGTTLTVLISRTSGYVVGVSLTDEPIAPKALSAMGTVDTTP
jgi:hypothetical protein